MKTFVAIVAVGIMVVSIHLVTRLTAAGWEVELALLAIVSTGVIGFFLERWYLALPLTGIGAIAGVWHVSPWPLAPTLLLAVMSGGVGFWSQHGSPRGVRLRDAFFAIFLLAWVSLALSALVALSPAPLSRSSLAVLLALYLSTPVLEYLTLLMVLGRAQQLGAFLRENYARRRHLWQNVSLGLATGVGLIMMTSVLVSAEQRLMGVKVKPNNPFVTSGALSSHHLLGAMSVAGAVIVLAPLAEEALFRGLLFGRLKGRLGMWPAALVSGIIFGAAHLNATLAVPLAMAGVALAFLYAHTRSLVASTVAHMTLNAVSVLAALFFVR